MKFDKDCQIEKAASLDTSRPGLENVYFDKDKCKLIATDGRRMAIIPCDPENGDVSGLVSPAALKEYRKQSKKALVSLELNGTQKVGAYSLERPTQEQNGNFPNWEMVLPKASDKVTFEIGLNAELLVELAKAIGSSDGVVKLKFIDSLKVIQVSTSKGEGLLMPVRV